VLLSTARLNRIVRLYPAARVAVVQCGVRNLAISQAAAPFGLFYAPDPSSQIACTIGGNVAANSGGVHRLKYGLTLHNVLGLRVAMADGTLLEVGGEALDGPGLDLLALIVGSEGTLGIVTEVTVRLLPRPTVAQVILASFPDVASDANAVSAVIAAGLILRLCVACGGTVTGEHGVGVEKLDAMCQQFGAAELDAFAAIRRAFDPQALLNPGKAIPTLHRCAEFGRMHVHGGQLAFPHLPRL